MNNNIKVSIDNGNLSLQICDLDFILDQEQCIYIMNNTMKKWIMDNNSKYPYFNNNETHKKEFINKMKESPIASDKKQKYKNYYYLKNLLLKTANNSI